MNVVASVRIAVCAREKNNKENNRRREARRPWASRHFLWKCPGPAGAAPTNSNRVSRLKHPTPSEDNNRKRTRTGETQGTTTYIVEPLVGERNRSLAIAEAL